MGMLRALEARLRDGYEDSSTASGDGYFIRTKDDEKLGPMPGGFPLTRARTSHLADAR